MRGQIWDLYRDLIAYKNAPSSGAKAELEARFDAIFQQRTGFATLDKLLKRLRANKAELLVVLDRPEIPLHTNATENTVRDYVTKRKVSGRTRSDHGRDCRDAFLGLLKTCKKQGVKFWDYLGARLKVPTRSKSPACPHSSRPAAPPADLRKVVAAPAAGDGRLSAASAAAAVPPVLSVSATVRAAGT